MWASIAKRFYFRYTSGMNINIKGTNIGLTPAITSYIEKRLEPAGKFLEGDSSAICNFEVAKTSRHHKSGDIFRAEAHIVAAKRDIFVESEQGDLYAAIDVVRDEIIHRLSSDKGRRLSRMRRGGMAVKNIIKGLWGGRVRGE
jgi:putative sigma-54 modulation protein